MKNDQIVRIVAAAAVVTTYGIHVGINGGERVDLMMLGTWHPFPLTVFVLLAIAFPELLDRLPVGPTRK